MRYAAPPFVLLDLDAHQSACARCCARGLCSVGRGIVRLARSSLLSAAERGGWRRMAQA